MILDLLRHAEPKGGRLYRGNQDDALTDKGWNQMLDSTQNTPVVVLNEGLIMASGTMEEVQADERVVEAYLGR